ncbi:MAG: DUF4179 domain-containing protein [Chloroflexota bacterium]|nr:DUF4179 domain-containing protein [Chloroflexota bacterium]
MPEHDFISSMQAALQEVATDIPEDTDLFPRIRQHLLLERVLKSRPTPLWRQRRFVLTSGFLVAAVLIFSGFTLVAPALFSWLGDPSLKQITLDHATPINRQVTVHGISLHLDQAYADAARTAITYHVISSSSVAPGPLFFILTDDHHQTYSHIVGAQFRDQALLEFAPLAPDVLNHRQILTFTVKSMIIRSATGRPVTTLDGIWSITFPLQPLLDRSVKLTSLPLVQQGLAIEPLQLDFAPTGARLLLQISGLAPGTSVNMLAEFATHIEISGISPTDHMGLSLSDGAIIDGALLQLRLPDGSVLVPAVVQPWDSTADAAISPTSQEQPVGVSGKVLLQVLFFTALPVTQGPAMLTVGQVHIAPVSAKHYTKVPGPWTFSLSLQR